MLLVPSAAGGVHVAMAAGGCSALGPGWPLTCLLAYFALFPVGLSLTEWNSPGVVEQLRGEKGGPGSKERSRGERLFPGSLGAFSTGSCRGGGVRSPLA